jgi:hypothetical protein
MFNNLDSLYIHERFRLETDYFQKKVNNFMLLDLFTAYMKKANTILGFINSEDLKEKRNLINQNPNEISI